MWHSLGAHGNLAAMLRIGTFLLASLGFVALVGCAYPRRSTALSPVSDASSGAVSVPDDLHHITFVSAQIPPRERSGLAWDDDGAPDAFVRLYRNDELVWEGTPVDDTLTPAFGQSPPRNVSFPRDAAIRIELWDRDSVQPQIIGVWRNRGLPPNALPDADVGVMLDGGAQVLFRLGRPAAHRGVGIPAYEARGGSLRVLEVDPFSPAGRAGVRPGDDIVSIGGERVGDLGEARAASALSLAADRQQSLTIERAGAQIEAPLDRGFVWLSM
jgi:membrane-associated protease RseP (regulator of RpoE activity)